MTSSSLAEQLILQQTIPPSSAMDYVRLSLHITKQDGAAEVATALLADIGFESFEEMTTGIHAYIPADDYQEAQVAEALAMIQGVAYEQEVSHIEHTNWNEKWEESFHPVEIGEECVIRAPFHEARPDVTHNIVIQPQMSFGTGHHQTTELMVRFLLEEGELSGLKVLDVGTGTGVLAILAERLGATEILGTDIDDHIVQNAQENVLHNSCVNIAVEKADLQHLSPAGCDVTLANINLNALLAEMEHLAQSLAPGGRLYLSGFYDQDAATLVEAAGRYGLQSVDKKTRDHWTALKLTRPAS